MSMSVETLGARERDDIWDESEEKPSMPDQPRIVARDPEKDLLMKNKYPKVKSLYAKKGKRKC